MGGELSQRRRHGSGTGKLPQVTAHVGNFRQHQPDFTHIAFRLTFAQVVPQSVTDFRLPGFNGSVEPIQSIQPEGHGQCGSGAEEIPLRG